MNMNMIHVLLYSKRFDVLETITLQGLGTYTKGVAGVFAEYINVTHTSMTELVVCSVTSKIGELSNIR